MKHSHSGDSCLCKKKDKNIPKLYHYLGTKNYET